MAIIIDVVKSLLALKTLDKLKCWLIFENLTDLLEFLMHFLKS